MHYLLSALMSFVGILFCLALLFIVAFVYFIVFILQIFATVLAGGAPIS